MRLLGYERDVGPLVIRRIVRALTGQVTFVSWADVADTSDRRITVGKAGADLEELGGLPDRRAASAER
ncbi:MAG: hypothetical protein ACR2FP_08165 [Nocardioidaceae bacterium]